MSKSIFSHGIRHEISNVLDFLAAVAHGHTHGTVFKHGNVYLGIPKGDGILKPAADMLQQLINSMGLGDALDTQIAKQCRFSYTAPGTCLKVREGFLSCQEVIVAFQDKADLVQVIPINILWPFALALRIASTAEEGKMLS